MESSPLFWLLLNLFSIIILAFYSMEEMACVSFNKLRLQYYVAQGSQRASWIDHLLHQPTRLFTTTLIGVNVATFVGSECARQFHISMGISPDLAPLSQIFVVIVFGELAPMFAARRYAEHVALLGSPILYASSKILTPFIWILGKVSEFANYLMGGKMTQAEFFLSQDELQKLIEEQDEGHDSEDVSALASNLFNLRHKTARMAMTPIESEVLIPAQSTLQQARKYISRQTPYALVYHRLPHHIVGIAYIRELLRTPDHKKIRDCTRPPWFISEKTPILQILRQFRSNSESCAIILNDKGTTSGFLSLDTLLEVIFGKATPSSSRHKAGVIDKSVSGEILLSAFNQEFGTHLEGTEDETLSDYLLRNFEHHPEPGDSLSIPPYEITIKESSLREVISIQIKTKTL